MCVTALVLYHPTFYNSSHAVGEIKAFNRFVTSDKNKGITSFESEPSRAMDPELASTNSHFQHAQLGKSELHVIENMNSGEGIQK